MFLFLDNRSLKYSIDYFYEQMYNGICKKDKAVTI